MRAVRNLLWRIAPNTLAADHVEQLKRRTARSFGAAVELRHIADGQIQIPGEYGLTQMRLLAERPES